ncbi:MAG: dTMP kinase, partial [Eggerthellaceae bacterium]|nr:dTMP kinase [Eggerthellaceae bacterium]
MRPDGWENEMRDKGIFITFEGGDGAGKSTHLGYLTIALRERGLEVIRLREPGGTTIGEQLRSVVLDPQNDAMVDECELLIYEAARAQIVGQVIRPALERGAIVLCDRFADSTLAYQHFGRGMEREWVDRSNEFACQGVHPDRTILMLTGGNAQVGLARATRNQEADRLENAGVAFHNRVIAGFLALAAEDPARIRKVVS